MGEAARGNTGTGLLPQMVWRGSRWAVTLPKRFIEGGMDWFGGESQEQEAEPGALSPFPRIWIGYLLGAATLIAEMIAVTLLPELAKEPLIIPPLYLFLANFVILVYWLVFVFEYHVVLGLVTAGGYSVSPLRAARFPF